MPDYSFANLSTFDFELLVRDLLQADRSLRLEAFGPGPDQGIDLRCASGSDGTLIVQCKHKPNSRQADVVRTFKQEVSKVAKLAPSQYIAATSASPSPIRKTEVEQLFKPYCLSTDDVIAREDINGLLSRHPDVEKAHFKLWLASTAVLERLLNARLYGETYSMSKASVVWSFFSGMRNSGMCQGRCAPDTCSCPSFIVPIPGRLLSSRACFRFGAMCEVAAD